jgi:protein-tyrosine phosphatase
VEHKASRPGSLGGWVRWPDVFVDVHSHVVPSGDDGVKTEAEGLELCREAAERGTAVLFATPHVWPHFRLDEEREEDVRAAHARMAVQARRVGLDLRLGWELTPTPRLLSEDVSRYRLGGLPAVLMEVPFVGSLELAEALAEKIEAAGLTPVIAHPERAAAALDDPAAARRLRTGDRLLQVNTTSLLGYHGAEIEAEGWRLVDEGLADLVGSDGHRLARPPFLDAAYELVRARVGEAADALFDGRALPGLVGAADGLDLAQRG